MKCWAAGGRGLLLCMEQYKAALVLLLLRWLSHECVRASVQNASVKPMVLLRDDDNAVVQHHE